MNAFSQEAGFKAAMAGIFLRETLAILPRALHKIFLPPQHVLIDTLSLLPVAQWGVCTSASLQTGEWTGPGGTFLNRHH